MNITSRTASRRSRTIRGIATRALTVGVLAAVPAVALVGPAHAATNVVASAGKLSVNSADLADRITISKLGGTLTVTNTADTLITGGVCTQVNANTVTCPAAGITNVLVNTQGGDDTVTNSTGLNLRGFMGPGADSYTGSTAQDFVSGDDGDDVLRGGAGNGDILVGNAGNDSASGGTGTGDICDTEFRSSTCEA